MFSTNEYLNILHDYKSKCAEKYGIERIGIFGSVACGKHHADSDVDICVEMKKPDMFILIDIKDDLQQIFNRKVDIICLWKNMNPFLLKTIKETAIYA